MRDIKIYDYITKHKVKCKCGHKVFITKYDKIICSWCGNYVFKDKKKEFDYRLKEMLNNEDIHDKLNELYHKKWLCEFWIYQSKEDIKNENFNLRGAKIVFDENCRELVKIKEEIETLEKCLEILK